MIPSRYIFPCCTGFATICATVAALLVQDPVCKVDPSFFSTCLERLSSELQVMHYIAVIAGVVLTVMGFSCFIYRENFFYISIVVVSTYIIGVLMSYGILRTLDTVLGARHPEAYDPAINCERMVFESRGTIDVDCKAGFAVIVLDLLVLVCSFYGMFRSFDELEHQVPSTIPLNTIEG